MLNLILGKSKSGKSKYIYQKIDDLVSQDCKLILFVPSQLRAYTEQNYMSYQKKQGIIDITITTISEYIAQKLKETNIYFDKNYITKLDRKLILTKIILQNPSMFKVFSKVSKKQGFIDSLNIYIDILKKENIDIQKLDSLDLSDNLVKLKLDEILKIYSEYIKSTEGKFVDQVDQMKMFCDKFLKTDKVSKKSYIFFDGYNNFTESEFSFIFCLLSNNFDVTISLDTDICQDDSILKKIAEDDIFSESNYTYKKLFELAHKANVKINTKYMQDYFLDSKNDIKYLANNIFKTNAIKKIKSDNISILLTSNMYSEIEELAKDIKDKVVNQGKRYLDFVIYTANVQEYQYVINQVFYKYDIPVYINTKIKLASNNLVLYISKLLQIIEYDFKTENIFEILKLGLNDISDSDVALLENYVLEFNIKKYNWDKEFNLNNSSSNDITYDLEKVNDIRLRVLEIFKDIKKYQTQKYTTFQIVSAIYNHLINNNVISNYQKQVDLIANSKNSELIFMSNIKKQVWDKLCEIFDSIAKIYQDQKLSIEDFSQIYQYVIKDIELKSIPATIDQVNVLDINSDKTNIKKIAYFIGVNENKLPKKQENDPLFSDSELDQIKNKSQIELKKPYTSKYNMGLYNIYQALNNVTDKIYFYVPVSDMSGRALRMSSLILSIQQVIDIKLTGNVTSSIPNLKYQDIDSNNNLFCYMMCKLNDIYDDKTNDIKDDIKKDEKYILDIYQIIGIYKYLNSNETRYKGIINYIKNDSNLNKKTLNNMYDKKLTTSVSKLESFKCCPFSYYMNYGLKLKPRKIFNITSMDIGSFMHSVLQKFSDYMFKNSISWPGLLVENENTKLWQNQLDKIISDELTQSFLKHGQSVKYNILKQKLISTMKKVVIVIAKSFNQSDFVPYGYEIEFKDGAIFAPIHIKLEQNKDMYLIGKIDRVDVLKLQDKIYTRIVDYKSSSKMLNLDDVKEGLSLQLITYLYAFIQNEQNIEKKSVIPAAAVYFNLSDKLLNLDIDQKDQVTIENKIIATLKMKGIFLKNVEILNKMDNKFSTPQSLIDVSTRSVNDQKSKKALEQNEYLKLCSDIKTTLKDIGDQIMDGVVEINPVKKKDVCKYCNYSSICRKDICL